MIYKLFTDEETDSILTKLNKNFVDGKKSQKLSNVYNIKENKETLITPKIDEYIGSIFKNKKAIKKIYAPTKIKNRIYNNYNTNDFYDYHVDSFQSSDSKMIYNYGFTISLSDDYEGGDFVLQTEAGEIAYNIGKGQIVIFPIIYPHKVTPIISGRRQNIIGWFESNITYEQSFILKNLEEVLSINLELLKTNSNQQLFKELLTKTALVQNYLVTKWGF
jgi:PKHD-type hydroxylase|tara:strand:+ start:75 stop:731 length:657 start_codon:yes stop_codon:yes gene_type:complete